MILILAALCTINAGYGWHWSRLDHNPWAGKPLGGMFSGFSRPGAVPGHLRVDQINARGRLQLYLTPVVFVIGTLLLSLS